MNNRPVVLPGIVTGVIALAALTGFANLPEEEGANTQQTVAAATALKPETQVSACRGWNSSVASAGLDAQLKQFSAAAGKGAIPSALQQQYATMSSSVLQFLAQTAASPEIASPISASFRDLASGYKALETGVASAPAVAAAVKQIEAAQGDLDAACATFDA